MAEQGIVQYKDRTTGEPLTPDAVYERNRAEGRKLLPPANAAEARGAEAVTDHPATDAAIAAAGILGSIRNPSRAIRNVSREVKRAVARARSGAEALGKAGMEKAKERLGHTTDPRYKDRYHGPDDMTRDKNGKLTEWEAKGSNDNSTAVATDTRGNKQGSREKNLNRSRTMTEQKSKKIGLPSNRQGGPYTQDEVDLWQDVKDLGGEKAHISAHTNTETGQVRVYERDSRGNIVWKTDEFKLDDFDALKDGIQDEMSKTNGVAR